MTEPTEAGTGNAEELSRSLEGAMNQAAWQVEVPEEAASAPGAHATGAAALEPPPLLRIIEAMLFVGGPPLTAVRTAEAVRGLTPAQFVLAVDSLNREYRRQGRPYTIKARDHGYVLTLKPRFQPINEKLYGGPREARLSPQAIDVLALVAYRQPATKLEIDSVRGAESGALLRQLVRRGLVGVTHRGEAGHREVSYGTTARFLELFGLSSLDDLPQTQDLQAL